MNSIETKSGLSPELQEDTDAILARFATGQPLDPRIADRIRERGDRIREKIFSDHGVLDVGAAAIREQRE